MFDCRTAKQAVVGLRHVGQAGYVTLAGTVKATTSWFVPRLNDERKRKPDNDD
jgi:hypothetical protein